jgi:hypothetical protein
VEAVHERCAGQFDFGDGAELKWAGCDGFETCAAGLRLGLTAFVTTVGEKQGEIQMTNTAVGLAFQELADLLAGDLSGCARPRGQRAIPAVLILGALAAGSLWGQSNTFPSSGNVGIGTTSPGSNLQLGVTTPGSTSTPETLSLGGTYSSTAGANPKLKLYDIGGSTSTYGIGISAGEMDFIDGPSGGFAFFPNANSAAGMIITSGGNVGIGATSPSVQLQVSGSDEGTSDWGNHSQAVLLLNNSFGAADVGGEIQFSQYALPPYAAITSIFQNGTGNSLGSLAISTRQNTSDTNLTPRLWVNYNGNVGIGTTNPAHLLHVAGTIGAEEVIVSATGADYVFDPGYKLAALSEVAEYVRANQHLPGIPSAAEVEEKGFNVGEMQTKLLAKIEELTLHMIEAEKENQALRDRVARLEAGSDKGEISGSR